MANADDVMNALFPANPGPGDTITVYDGADPLKNGFAPWRAWDLRGWVRQLTWDLLRFRPIEDGRPNADRTIKFGLFDAVMRVAYQTDQNNQILRRLATKHGVDLTDLPS
ncbi:hypothetical protein [Mycobacterium sp. SMC-11]|uniref:hypothetical protein n=1 Tax=Mycobacterium sp. SMC-11 TaxID=3385969 RepID=UPI00390C5B98